MSDIRDLTQFIKDSDMLLWRELSSRGEILKKEILSADRLTVTPVRASAGTFYRLDVSGGEDLISMKKISEVLVLEDFCRVKRDDDNVVELQRRVKA